MGIARDFIKKITHPFLVKGANYYYRKPRPYTYKGITVQVHPEVFPPHLTISTRVFLDYISLFEFDKKQVLELGCGSGIISLYAKQKGATVTASDINKIALSYLEEASKTNQLPIRCIYSDLFDNLKGNHFDFIVINPPYYPKKAESIKEQAWFCGEGFEYFHKLFQQLPDFNTPENRIWMILSEDCEITTITTMAATYTLEMKPLYEKKRLGEWNTIFEVF